ncbi:UNVERIFIED_CONTAM: hypothetical protein GTU68_024825 [Idotea baltica]|nr:hypothetical protein [Idotea baltica]
MIGDSLPMLKIKKTLGKVSATMADVLILGENGTGKQHLAREIHQLSDQKSEAFIHVDMGALSENLFESELFGHKKGAFTDAKEDKVGRFELANDGTIFLDEIGNLPLSLQAKLLTVLQDRKVSRLGDGKERAINARMIFATNSNLTERVAEGTFREDLLYRINTIEIEIPPLRDRPSDIPEFVALFLDTFKEKYNKSDLKISREALKVLQEHKWPGNVRELQHTIERGVILSDGNVIETTDFNFSKSQSIEAVLKNTDNLNINEIEVLLIQKAIEKHNGNISKASKDLGLTRAALYRRMEKHNL